MGWWRRLLRRNPKPVPVILFTRAGCHLCDKAAEMLRTASGQVPLTVEVIDINTDPQLVSQYGDMVPVLRIAGKDRFFGCINPVLLRRTLRAEISHVRVVRKSNMRTTQP